MHLITVMSEDRSGESYVLAQTLSELISAARTELDLDADESYTVFQEPSGIKIGADAVLQLLASNAQKSQQALEVIVSSSRAWKPTSASDHLNTSQNKSPSTPRTRILVESNSVDNDRCPVLPMRPIVEILNPVLEVMKNPESISPQAFLKLKKTAIKEVYHQIGKFMFRSSQDLSLPNARQYARTVINYQERKYAKIFEISVGQTIVNDGLGTLTLKIYNHVNYSKGEDKKNKRGKKRPLLDTEEGEDIDGDLMQIDKNALDYGCVCYAPPLPEDETEETQESKRKQLLSMDPHHEEAGSFMKVTFASQRADLNRTFPLSTKLVPTLDRWPLLCHRDHLFRHADGLLGKQVLDLWHKNLGNKGRRFCDFMMAHWANLNDKKPSQHVKKMMDFLDLRSASFETIGQMANSIALFPLLIGYLKEEDTQLFLLLSKTTSDEDMLAAAKQKTACPILVIRGSSIFEEEALFNVVMLGKININAINFIEGILTVFITFFVFGFQYPSKICRSLEFIQRFLLEINPEKGSRREQPSRLIDGLDAKVKDLSEKLAYHSSDWGSILL